MANLLLRGALILLLFPAVVYTDSHWESYAAWEMGYSWTCYPYYYTYCTDWYSYPYYLGYTGCGCSQYQPYSSVCYQATGWNCYTNCIGWILVTRWKCQPGWQGCNCDIPICNPACRVDQICAKPNFCDCYRGPNGNCLFEPCDDGPTANCYPGYCNKTAGSWFCACPAGFEGPNCQTITAAPDIESCYVQIFGTPNGQIEQEVARANECAAPGLDPLPVWIGQSAANQLTKIVVNWQASYDGQVLPGRDKAPYILEAPVPIGIVETNFTVSFPGQTGFTPRSTYCIGPDPVYVNPPTIKQCIGEQRQWTDLGVSSIVKTNNTFVITIEAKVGGVKNGDNTQAGGRFYTPQYIAMDPSKNTTIRTTKFAFDLETPYHCLSTMNNCSVFPIFISRSMTNNPVIQPTFNDWKDDASGIDRFYVEVYYMKPDINSLLVPVGAPLTAENVNITLNNFRFTCNNSGAYSIVLTVYDKANNSAKARKILNYDNHGSSFYETASPIYLSSADPATDYKFITRLDKPANGITPYQFTVNWGGHFAISSDADSLLGVNPWTSDPTINIDDNRGSKYGLRSIDSFTKETGVSGYELAYSVDTRSGGVGAVAPADFTIITDRLTTSFPLSIASTLKDGNMIVVWLKVFDLYGKNTTIVTKTPVDTSSFSINITKQKFVKHFPDQLSSSVIIDVENSISGIKNITYEIYDRTSQLSVYTGSVLPEVLEAQSAIGSRNRSTVVRSCLSNDPTCYCIPTGTCYNRTQIINIDNCWIDKSVADDQVTIKYTVYSLAGWGLDAEVDAGTLSKEDILCRDPGSVHVALAIGLGVGLGVPIIITIVVGIVVFVVLLRKKHRKRTPRANGANSEMNSTSSPTSVLSTVENDKYQQLQNREEQQQYEQLPQTPEHEQLEIRNELQEQQQYEQLQQTPRYEQLQVLNELQEQQQYEQLQQTPRNEQLQVRNELQEQQQYVQLPQSQ